MSANALSVNGKALGTLAPQLRAEALVRGSCGSSRRGKPHDADDPSQALVAAPPNRCQANPRTHPAAAPALRSVSQAALRGGISVSTYLPFSQNGSAATTVAPAVSPAPSALTVEPYYLPCAQARRMQSRRLHAHLHVPPAASRHIHQPS